MDTWIRSGMCPNIVIMTDQFYQMLSDGRVFVDFGPVTMVMMASKNGVILSGLCSEVALIIPDLLTEISQKRQYLSQYPEENDKVQGFSVGGDDYIVKPFSLVELEARVQAHLRREERHQTNTKVKFSGELLIDYSERTVYIQNQPIGLVKKEFDIVELLSQNAGQVFDKERIYERVWGYDSEGDSSVVAEHIRRIRTKIAAYTNKKTYK